MLPIGTENFGITLPDCTYQCVNCIMELCYTGQSCLPRGMKVSELITAAELLGLEDVLVVLKRTSFLVRSQVQGIRKGGLTYSVSIFS